MTHDFGAPFFSLFLEAVIDAVDEGGETHASAMYNVRKYRIANDGELLGEHHVLIGDKTAKCAPCFTNTLHPW